MTAVQSVPAVQALHPFSLTRSHWLADPDRQAFLTELLNSRVFREALDTLLKADRSARPSLTAPLDPQAELVWKHGFDAGYKAFVRDLVCLVDQPKKQPFLENAPLANVRD